MLISSNSFYILLGLICESATPLCKDCICFVCEAERGYLHHSFWDFVDAMPSLPQNYLHWLVAVPETNWGTGLYSSHGQLGAIWGMRDLRVLSLVVATVVAVGALAGGRGVWRMGKQGIWIIKICAVFIYRIVHGVAEGGILKGAWRT